MERQTNRILKVSGKKDRQTDKIVKEKVYFFAHGTQLFKKVPRPQKQKQMHSSILNEK